MGTGIAKTIIIILIIIIIMIMIINNIKIHRIIGILFVAKK